MLRAMASVGDNYILPGKEDHDRLRTISDLHDERTHTLLHRAGLAPGCRFVEFGCGLGYVTRWAAAEGAAATGIDVNEEQVHACRALAREAGLEGATFRTGSVYEPGFETGTIDVSYNRWLLVHLNRPVDAMRAIHEILKPGGVMVCEEADVSAIYAEPPSTAYDEMREIAIRCWPRAGRRLHRRPSGTRVGQGSGLRGRARGCLPSALHRGPLQRILELDASQRLPSAGG